MACLEEMEMVVEGSKPENETETLIYENMKNRTAYFQKFGTKENYVISSTAFLPKKRKVLCIFIASPLIYMP